MGAFLGILFGIGSVGCIYTLVNQQVTGLTFIAMICLWSIGVYALIKEET